MLSHLVNIYLVVLCLVSGLAFWKYKYLTPFYIRLFAWTLWATFIIELTGKIIPSSKEHPNSWLFNMYMPVLYFLLSNIYYGYFNKQLRLRNYIRWSQLLFLIAAVVNMIFGEGLNIFATYSAMLMCLLLLIWVLLFFRSLLQNPIEVSLIHIPLFWISTGLLIFYGISVFILGTINYFNRIHDDMTAYLLWQIIHLLNIIMNCLFFIALLCQPRRRIS